MRHAGRDEVDKATLPDGVDAGAIRDCAEHPRPALWLPSPPLLETLRRRWQVVLDGGEQRVRELDLVQEGQRLQRPSKLRKGELPLVWL